MDDGERERSDVAGPSVHSEPPTRFRCLALNRNGLLSLLDPRGRRHSRHIGGSDALGHACAQSGEPINIGYSMSVTAVLRQMAEHLPFRRLRFRKSHDFQGLQVSDLQIGAVAYRLNRLFDGGGRGQEKTVRVHPSSRRILELRASSCLFRKTDGASSKSGFAGTKASRVAAGQESA